MKRSSFLLFRELLINYNKLTKKKKLDAVDKMKQTPGPWSGTWLKQQYIFGIIILFSDSKNTYSLCQKCTAQ